MSVIRSFCSGCGQERLVHDGLCGDCLDHQKHNQPTPLILYVGIVAFGLAVLFTLGSAFFE